MENLQIPNLLKEGLETYLSKNAFSAVKVWTSGSANANHAHIYKKSRILAELEYAYSSFLGYDIQDFQVITSTVHLIFLIFRYEKGKVSAKFLTYKQSKNWIIANFIFSTSFHASEAFLL